MPTDSNYSLNDLMYTGPNLQKDMLTLIINWRVHRYVLTADVEKMYRNIMLHEDQQHLQKIWWRDSSQERLQEMQLCTVTYGTKAAPYLAMRTLHQLARDEGHMYPEAATALQNYFYMDDLVHGKDDVESAKKLIRDLNELMSKGGFNLRKWASNEPSVLTELLEEQKCEKKVINFKQEKSQQIKTLGLSWNPDEDNFTFNCTLPNSDKVPTKRSLLSDISKLYDPLGWLSPTIIKAKLLFQSVWVSKITWDENLPPNIQNEWIKLKEDLPNITKLSLRRWLCCYENEIEIHGFCDASEKAYACSIYSRTVNDNGDNIITLITAKTKVAPLSKKVTLPRLELCGALLLAKLIEKVKSTITSKNLHIYCWTDSKVVLAWLQGNVNRWEKYVANRVTQIVNIVSADQWQYVKSEDNPADCATRGILPSQLLTLNLWWEGPQWLKTFKKENKETGKKFTTESEVKQSESEAASCCVTKTEDSNPILNTLLNKCNTFKRVIRVTTYLLRFISALRNKQTKHNETLTKEEMEKATELIIKNVQRQHFGDEIEQLKGNGTVGSKSNILKLTPFLDEKGILRVRGRLENSTLTAETKHPIILPPTARLTQLIIDDAHKQTLHGGARLTLALTRQLYWIISGAQTVKKQLRLCLRCKRFKPQKNEQIMADLPKQRVVPSRPFSNTGIDFTGHVDVKINKGRGVKTCKAYIAIFICMVTKAVHLELVSDLSTQTFLAALKRMCARRGTPKHIHSDNGTNFVGAAKQLKEDFKRYQTFISPEFHAETNNMQIEWHFNAPLWPTAGGLWEAAVKSMKYHLKRVIGEQKLTFEQFSTLLAEIEACMNSRPLMALTEDPDDLDYLTPGHFLVGGPVMSLPQEDNEDLNKFDLRNIWRLVEQINQHFWRRWSNDYLHEMQTRGKWHKPTKNLEEGDIVLLKENNLPPGKWAMGRVEEIHPGSDGYVRVVTLKTKGGQLKRPITKLVPLLTDEGTEHQQTRKIDTAKPEKQEKRNASRTRFSYLTLLNMMFMIIYMMGIRCSAQTANYKITTIEKDHPIYFDETGNLQLIHDEWTLFVYYNLTTRTEKKKTENKKNRYRASQVQANTTNGEPANQGVELKVFKSSGSRQDTGNQEESFNFN